MFASHKRSVYTTPFGKPVVPDVCRMVWMASGDRWTTPPAGGDDDAGGGLAASMDAMEHTVRPGHTAAASAARPSGTSPMTASSADLASLAACIICFASFGVVMIAASEQFTETPPRM
jgi:hypothetical protein